MGRKIRIAALQLSGPVKVEPETAAKDKSKVVERLTGLVRIAAREGVHIACTVELSLTPFFCRKIDPKQ